MGDDCIGQLFQDEISNRKYSWVPIGRDVTSDRHVPALVSHWLL